MNRINNYDNRGDIIDCMHQILSNTTLCLYNVGTWEAPNMKIIFRKFFFNMVIGTRYSIGVV